MTQGPGEETLPMLATILEMRKVWETTMEDTYCHSATVPINVKKVGQEVHDICNIFEY